MLAEIAETAARAGKLDRAEVIARSITDSEQRERVLAQLTQAAARAGDLDRAETIARWISYPGQRVQALAAMAEVAARAGDLDRAETLAKRAETAALSISNPDQQARALADLARKVSPNRARSLLAQALTTSHWEATIVVLAQISPVALGTLVDEYLSATAPPRDSL